MTIDIRGLDKLRNKLRRMDAELAGELVNAMTRATALVQREAARYPGASGRKMQFKSARQRRFVMMLVRAGRVPYRRTGTLGRTIAAEVKAIGNDVVGTVGTNAVHAPWVKGHAKTGGAGPQARYHRGNWKTLVDDLKSKARDVRAIFRAMLKQWVNK